MKNNTTTALVAAGALLVGGVATAAYMSNRPAQPMSASAVEQASLLPGATALDDVSAANADIPVNALQYADVLGVKPVTGKEQVYAAVIGTEAVRETTTTTTPQEVCRDVVVQERAPERDGNVGGTVAGAVIGGLLGNQVGGGNGRKVATAAGAVAGGVIGNRVDRNHVGGQVVNRTERQCHIENASAQSSRVTGYNVTYRNPDGTSGTMRVDSKPGKRIAMGTENVVKAYDVTYRYQGVEKTIRMDERPTSNRLPVVDGEVVAQGEQIAAPRG